MTGVRIWVRRRGWLVWFSIVALAIAVAAAVLAQDVRSWRNTLQADAVSYSVAPTAKERWTAPTILPASLSERLLGVARDRRQLSALRFFALAHSIHLNNSGLTSQDEQLLQTAQGALGRVANDPDVVVASQAYIMLGVLLFTDARASFPPDAASYLSAVAAMQNAVRADGDNSQAKADLEMLLRQQKVDFARKKRLSPSNESSHHGKVAGRGKGAPPKAPGGDY
jgi:hypothetical protein